MVDDVEHLMTGVKERGRLSPYRFAQIDGRRLRDITGAPASCAADKRAGNCANTAEHRADRCARTRADRCAASSAISLIGSARTNHQHRSHECDQSHPRLPLDLTLYVAETALAYLSSRSGLSGSARRASGAGEPIHRDFILSAEERRRHAILCVARCASEVLELDL
jgi:hypothetical protein